MAFGIRTINAGGYTQIDENYSNYVILTSGYSVLSDAANSINGGSSIGPAFGIPNYGVTPMVFVRNPGDWHVGLHSYGPGFLRFVKEYTGTNFDYGFEWMIAIPSSVVIGPQPGFGIEVYTASGAVAFTQNAGYPRVQDVLTTPTTGWFGDYAMNMSVYHPNPWMLVNNIFGVKFIGDQSMQLGYTNYFGIKSTGGTQVVLRVIIEQGGLGYTETSTDMTGTIAVLKN
jgi:hypothetical protein